MRVIQINTFSHSLVMKDYERDLLNNWYAQVAYKIKEADKKIDIECWTLERFCKTEKTKQNKGVKFRIFPTTFSLRHGMEISFSMLKALKEEIKKNKEKLIIHFHGYHTWQVYLFLFFLEGNFIAQHHGGRNPLESLKKYKILFLTLPIILFMQLCESVFLKKIKIFYSLSEEETSYLKRITTSKVKFQTMGVEEKDYLQISKSFARKKLKLDTKKYLVYIGRMKKTKGIKELFDAMSEIKDPQIKLLIIGGGQEDKKYREYSKRLSLKNIEFLGPIYGKRKFLYLKAADAFILPSHTEGAPVALMEAIASNTPVIATGVGGVRKMIKDGREGIIITPKSKNQIKNSIYQILKWKKKNVQEYSKKYFWKKIIKNTLEDYFSLP